MDQRLAPFHEQHTQSLKQICRLAAAGILLAFAATAWGILYPYPHLLAFFILAALPLLTLWICWRHKDFVSFFYHATPSGNEPSWAECAGFFLGGCLYIPGFGLCILTLALDIRIIDLTQLIVPTILGTVVLAFAITRVAPNYRKHLGHFACITLAMVAYPPSVTVLINALFDYSHPTILILPVLGKHETEGYYQNRPTTTGHYLYINSQGGGADIPVVGVSEEFFSSIEIGQPLCLSIQAGAVGLRWYLIKPAVDCER